MLNICPRFQADYQGFYKAVAGHLGWVSCRGHAVATDVPALAAAVQPGSYGGNMRALAAGVLPAPSQTVQYPAPMQGAQYQAQLHAQMHAAAQAQAEAQAQALAQAQARAAQMEAAAAAAELEEVSGPHPLLALFEHSNVQSFQGSGGGNIFDLRAPATKTWTVR